MKSTVIGRLAKLLQLLAVIVLLVGLSGLADAATISGTVTNNTTRNGRVYMYLQQLNGGENGLGVSILAPAANTPFAIRGVANGSYKLQAFVDGSGTGRIHLNDPTWISPGTIIIRNNSNYTIDTNTAVTFNNPLPNVSVQQPAGAMILPGDNGAFVGWDEPQDSNHNTIADSYKVYYSTTSSSPRSNPEGVITVPAGDQTFAILHIDNGKTLNVQVSSLVGTTESAASLPVTSATINPPAGGFIISGTINLSGISNPTGNLYVALVDRSSDKGGPVAVAFVANPPQLSGNNFTINTDSAHVPDGSYSLIALIDMDGDGKIGSGDVMANEQLSPTVNVTGNNITLDTPISLTASNSSPFLNTAHFQDSASPPNDGYQILLGAKTNIETLANITVTGGPANNGRSYPIDLGTNGWGEFQAWLGVSNRPAVLATADAYSLTISYANGAIAPDTLSLPVTTVLDSFATPTAPVGNLPYSSITNPTIFTWNTPVSPPSPYTYSFWVNANGFFDNNNTYSNLPSGTPSVSIPGLTYVDGQIFNWNINVQDNTGNQAQKAAWFIYTTGPGINSFTPTTISKGATLTINGLNFDSTPANNTVYFCGATTTATAASATQLQVVVPQNACSGSIRVNSNGKDSNYSFSQLNLLMNISGKVTSNGSNGIADTYAVLIDPITGIPVSGIPVALTDSGIGVYTITNVPAGSYKLYFSAGPGYQSQFYNSQSSFDSAQILTMSGGFSQSNVNATLTTAPNTGTIAGMVSNAGTAQPVYSAYIELLDTANNLIGAVSPVFSTSDGGFQLSAVPAGSYKLRISAAGYQTNIPVAVYAVTSGQMTPVSISIQTNPTTIIYTSKVTDSATPPNMIQNAQIDLIVGGTTTTNITSTDNNGLFSVVVPFQTSFYLRISKSGFVPENTSMLSYNQDTNTSNRPHTLQTAAVVAAWYTQGIATAQTAGTGTISGKAVSAANQLMTLPDVLVTATDGATAYLVCNESNGSVGACNTSGATTNANGKFFILNVPAGKLVTIIVSKSGYSGNSKSYQVAADTLTQGRIGISTSALSYTYTGKLVDTSTVAIPGAAATLFMDSNATYGQLSTDSNGLFTASDLLAGTPYYIKFSLSGYLDTYTANTSVNVNTDKTGRPITMYPSNQLSIWGFDTLKGAITGTIKDNLTGNSISDATISASNGTVVYDDGSGNPGNPATYTSTSANGRFYVRDVPPASKVTITVLTTPGGYDLTNTFKYYHVPAAGKLTQGSFYLNLKGNISATPATINFGSVSFGNSATPQPITISNSGPGSLTVSSVSTSGDISDLDINSGGATPCPALPATFISGQSCTLVASFTPSSSGSKSMTMSVFSDANNSPTLNITLSGQGTSVAPGPPVITSITPWDGQATVYFNPPNFNGGSPILSYLVTTNPSVTPLIGNGSPMTISGLTNDQAYTIYVSAFNGTLFGSQTSITTTPYFAPLRIGSTGYPNNLQTLLATAAADAVISAQAGQVTVTTSPLSLTKGVNLYGGFNSTYGLISGYTTIPGRVNIKGTSFKVVFKHIKVK